MTPEAFADVAVVLVWFALATILARHTCAHRVDELMAIYDELTSTKEQGEQIAVA